MDQLNPAESARLEMLVQKKQQKEFMKMFFKVTADCFDTCITEFTSKTLSPKEVTIPHFRNIR
jgi:mitochondrial import inner membrane translocase subunit TIM9